MDISSNYIDITYTVDEIHAMSKLIYKLQDEGQYPMTFTDPEFISFVDKTTNNDFLWDGQYANFISVTPTIDFAVSSAIMVLYQTKHYAKTRTNHGS